MCVHQSMLLQDAAARLRVAAATLRWQAASGYLRAAATADVALIYELERALDEIDGLVRGLDQLNAFLASEPPASLDCRAQLTAEPLDSYS